MSRFEVDTRTIFSHKDKEVRQILLRGIISAQTINQFRDILKDAVAARRPVLLDLSGVTYINSTGLGKLVLFFDQLAENGLCGGLINVNGESLRLIQMLGLQEVLEVYGNIEQALNALDYGKARSTMQTSELLRTPSGRFRISTAPPPRLPEARILLGMNPADPLAKLLRRALTGDKGHVLVSEDRDEIRQAITSEGIFNLAILDEDLQMYQQICLDLKLGPQSSLLSIIKIASGKSGGTNLRVCADEVIREPFDIQELFALAQSEYDRTHMESMLLIREIQLSFASSQPAVEEGVAMLEEIVGASGMEEIEASKYLHAVSEAVDNARKHGNKEDPFKSVKVQYILDREKVTVTVEDEGEGFDFKRRLEMAKNYTPLQQTRMISYEDNRAGLGINIMLKCCDNIEYTRPGNLVRLMKYL